MQSLFILGYIDGIGGKMDNIKQYVIDFIEGRVKASEVIGNCETNPEILNWI